MVVDMVVTFLPAGRSGSLTTQPRRKTRAATSGKFLLPALGRPEPGRRSTGSPTGTQRSGRSRRPLPLLPPVRGPDAAAPVAARGAPQSPIITLPPLLEYS